MGAKEGLAHLLLAIVGPGDCVLSPDRATRYTATA